MRDLVEEEPSTLIATRAPARRRSRRSRLIWVALSAALIAATIGGLRFGVPVAADAHSVSAGVFAVTLRGPGMLAARRHAVLGATVQGRLAALPVDTGDRVARGESIAQLESEEARLDLVQATEQVRAVEYQIAEAEAQRRREEATLTRFERELERQEELRARGIVADGALDIALAERDAGLARVAEAEARIERLKADLLATHGLVERRREALSQTTITAPFDGVVVSRAREIGDVVTPGAPILELVDPSTLQLSARLDESQMAKLATGQAATVSFESEPGRPHTATVDRIGREVDPETREFTIDLALASLPTNWAIGQRGAASIRVGERPDTITLPSALIQYRDGAPGAWALSGKRAEWRPLTLGSAGDDTVEIVAGLESGETVLDAPRLHDGRRVALRP
ncbi:MAG: efflux RND transporter periplasmic adaptor subunit [Pseudomonadota bacterium]